MLVQISMGIYNNKNIRMDGQMDLKYLTKGLSCPYGNVN